MAEENKKSIWLKFGSFCLKSPISCLFAVFILYYAAKIYVFGGDTIINKAIMIGLFALWAVYFALRHLFKFLLILALLGAVIYGFYAYSQREIKKCEDSGGVWNTETQTCEKKKTFWEEVKNLWQQFSEKIQPKESSLPKSEEK